MVAQGFIEPYRPVKECPVCGKSYYTNYPYCSYKCYKKAKEDKVKGTKGK